MATQTTNTVEKNRLSRRIRNFYRLFNENNWEGCFERLDPELRGARVEFDKYADSLASFFAKYGPMRIQSVSLELFMNAKGNKHDDRPFAYGTLHWQDNKRKQHTLRERWVKSGATWYTRMIGLV